LSSCTGRPSLTSLCSLLLESFESWWIVVATQYAVKQLHCLGRAAGSRATQQSQAVCVAGSTKCSASLHNGLRGTPVCQPLRRFDFTSAVGKSDADKEILAQEQRNKVCALHAVVMLGMLRRGAQAVRVVYRQGEDAVHAWHAGRAVQPAPAAASR